MCVHVAMSLLVSGVRDVIALKPMASLLEEPYEELEQKKKTLLFLLGPLCNTLGLGSETLNMTLGLFCVGMVRPKPITVNLCRLCEQRFRLALLSCLLIHQSYVFLRVGHECVASKLTFLMASKLTFVASMHTTRFRNQLRELHVRGMMGTWNHGPIHAYAKPTSSSRGMKGTA